MRNQTSITLHVNTPLATTVNTVDASDGATDPRVMWNIYPQGSPLALLTVFADPSTLARLALELVDLLPVDVIADAAVELNAERDAVDAAINRVETAKAAR